MTSKWFIKCFSLSLRDLGGHSSAKSEAYSIAGGPESSAWASSSASASAFASSNSYQGKLINNA